MVNNKKRKLTQKAYILPILAAFFTAALAWDGVRSQLVVGKAEDDIKVYTEWMKRIDSAIMDMREYNEIGRRNFKDGKIEDSKEYNVRRLHYLNKVAAAYTGVENIIDEDARSSVSLLNMFDESVKDIFSPTAPGDSAWELYLIRTNAVIRTRINQKKEKIKRAQSFIISRAIEDFTEWLFTKEEPLSK